jgi:hypothetical protein
MGTMSNLSRSEAGADSRLAETTTATGKDQQGASFSQQSEQHEQTPRRHTVDYAPHNSSQSVVTAVSSSTTKHTENMTAMAAAAAAAARELAATGQASGRLKVTPPPPPPGVYAINGRGHPTPETETSPGAGVRALVASQLPPLSKKPDQGKLVSSFFSSKPD